MVWLSWGFVVEVSLIKGEGTYRGIDVWRLFRENYLFVISLCGVVKLKFILGFY